MSAGGLLGSVNFSNGQVYELREDKYHSIAVKITGQAKNAASKADQANFTKAMSDARVKLGLSPLAAATAAQTQQTGDGDTLDRLLGKVIKLEGRVLESGVTQSGRKYTVWERLPTSAENKVFGNEPAMRVYQYDDTNVVFKICETEGKNTVQAKSKTGRVQISSDLNTMKKIASFKDKHVSWLAFRNLLEECGKLTPKDKPKQGFCGWEDISYMTAFRYQHWEKIMDDIGLGKYFRLAVKDDGYIYRSYRMDSVQKKTMAAIHNAYPGLSDYDALLKAANENA